MAYTSAAFHITQGLFKVVFFLVLYSGNHNIAAGKVSESGYVAAAAEINHGAVAGLRRLVQNTLQMAYRRG